METRNRLQGYKITANVPGNVEVSLDGSHVATFKTFWMANVYCDKMNAHDPCLADFGDELKEQEQHN